VTLADKLDVVILLGGDKDYMPLIWYMKSRGCKTEVWSFPETCSDMMKESADFFFPLDGSFIIRDRSSKLGKFPKRVK
jgi:uncharacterized LabA/DUF88 family protein